jgi:hypothetical protein
MAAAQLFDATENAEIQKNAETMLLFSQKISIAKYAEKCKGRKRVPLNNAAGCHLYTVILGAFQIFAPRSGCGR